MKKLKQKQSELTDGNGLHFLKKIDPLEQFEMEDKLFHVWKRLGFYRGKM